MDPLNPTAQEVEEVLGRLLSAIAAFTDSAFDYMDDEDLAVLENLNVRSFADAGVMTRNNGLVVEACGPVAPEFQLTIVKSR